MSYEDEVRDFKINEKYVDVEIKEIVLGKVMISDEI